MSRRLGVTQIWLREAVFRGDVPALEAGNRTLFDANATEDAIRNLARERKQAVAGTCTPETIHA